jgi:hypothetical protein
MKDIIIQKSIQKQKLILHGLEIAMALVVLIGVVFSFFHQIPRLIELDWSLISTFIQFLEVILFLAIGIELARLLISYSINSVIELLVFVLARKILLFEESALSLVLVVFSMVLLFAGKYFLMKINKFELDKN